MSAGAGGYSAEAGWALEQDRADPLAWCRERFELPSGLTGHPLAYFCGNSLGLMPGSVRDAVQSVLDDWSRLGVDAHLDAKRALVFLP